MGKTAIVIGAGIAGMVAARVAADHFRRVIILDRDVLPRDDTYRKGIPQSRHIHTLVRKGMDILDQLFPGLEQELLDHSGVRVDWGQDTSWMNPMGWVPAFCCPITTVSCSRKLLEHLLRQRLYADSRIELRGGCDIQGLIADSKANRISAVQLQNGELQAQLIIDASGRHGKTTQWLEQLGYGTVKETYINSFFGYASRLYHRYKLGLPWKQLYIQMKPPQQCRGGVMAPIEDGLWVVTLIGADKDYPPTNEQEFLEFAQSLRDPLFHQVIHKAEAATPIYAYRRTENRWRHYEKMQRWPHGFVALGDGVCSFNPVYGQGMTVAAISAMELRDWLARRYPQQPTQRFQQRLAKIFRVPWLIATSEDLRVAGVEGARPSWFIGILHWYLNGVFAGATRNSKVQQAFLEIVHMCGSASVLLRPDVVREVLRHSLTRNGEY